MTTHGRKKVVAEPTPPARDPRDVETIERLQQWIQELELEQLQRDSSAEETKTESNVWDDGSEDVNPFSEGNPRGGIVYYYDTDNKEEESMPVYDTDTEDVIEKEEGFVGKGGPNEEEEDGNKDEVVYADHINQNEFNGSVNNDTFGMPFLPLLKDSMSCEWMVLNASMLCFCIRNVKMPQLRRSAVLLLKSCSLYIDDEDQLQRVLPYVIAMLSYSSQIIRSAALETLCDILPLVRDFPPSDAKIFPEYILSMLCMLTDDPEESVRLCYASNISKLALTAYEFLIHSISKTEAGVLNDLSSGQKSNEIIRRLQNQKNDAQLAQFRKPIAEVIQELVMGPRQTPNIRRALLQDVGNICWQIIYICFFVGQISVEEFILPYLEHALGDSTKVVIVNALDCLAILCKSGILRKRILLEMIEHPFPLLCYPSQWVRRSVVTFISASNESLGAIDSYVFLVPLIRPFLRRQSISLASEKALFTCLKPPDHKSITSTMQSFSLGENNVEARLRTMGSFVHTASGSVDIMDPSFSDKLKFSGFMSPQISGANSLIGDKSSEGIPLYYFKYGKRTSGNAPSAPESSATFDALVSTPKLTSSSRGISNNPPQLHRVIHESEERELDQTIGVSSSLKGAIGDDSSHPTKTSGLPSFAGAQVIPDFGWRPRGVVVAHLQEHRFAINDISVSTNHCFFVTASDDSTVKVWDSRELEKDISFRSRLTYCLDGSRALCATMLHGSAQVVVRASDGIIHMFSVDYISKGLRSVVDKYSRIADVKKNNIGEGAILALLNYSSGSDDGKMILYSTQNCGIHLHDTKENSRTSFSQAGENDAEALTFSQSQNA
nr:phosphoinositide 3-kinase regulatory subunit 4 [Tanacetum cinerariifolium]